MEKEQVVPDVVPKAPKGKEFSVNYLEKLLLFPVTFYLIIKKKQNGVSSRKSLN